jgi:hypothetical protein
LVQDNVQGNTNRYQKFISKDFHEIGDSLLKNKYESSVHLLLAAVYPEYDWLPWKFCRCNEKYWDDPKNHKKFLDWAGKQLNIKEMSDWYKVIQKVNKIVT